MTVRMFEGTYEDNAQTVVFPVALPLRGMTNYENEDVDGPSHIDLHDEAALERWATAAFGEDWGIWDMEIPEGALVDDEKSQEPDAPTAGLRATPGLPEGSPGPVAPRSEGESA